MAQPTAATDELEISEETSARICQHMNEDHAVSVYAMARKMVEWPGPKWKISKALLQRVRRQGCDLQVYLCHDMMCQETKVTYPFVPPLAHSSQIRSRIIAVHHQVCSPSCTYRNPLFYLIAGFVLASASVALQGGLKGVDPLINTAVKLAFMVTLLGHTTLATYAAHLGRKELKLQMRGLAAWYCAILLSGTVAFLELYDLLNVHRKNKAAQKSK
jgi:Protein of unknown function (DUF2470)